jgi:hypothetical protein
MEGIQVIAMRKHSVKLSTLSDGPFGCCSSWQICELGKKPCAFIEDDPDYAALCACHKRFVNNQNQSGELISTVKGVEITDHVEEQQHILTFDSNGQGLLF